MKEIGKLSLIAVLAFFCSWVRILYAHCEIPCGIYDDEARFVSLAEDIATIEKSMQQISELSGDYKNINQVVRWVHNKEVHADRIRDVITQYFMTQRIQYPEGPNDQEAYKIYIRELTVLHQMLVQAMKTKQTTDYAHVQKLRTLLEEFHSLYHQPKDHSQKDLSGAKNNSVQLEGDKNT